MKLRSADEFGPGRTPTPEQALETLCHGTSRFDLPSVEVRTKPRSKTKYETIRTAAAVCQVAVTVAILCHVYGLT